MKALDEDVVSEVVYHSAQMVLFRTTNSPVWQETNATLVPKKMLAKALLKRPKIDIACMPKESEFTKIVGALLMGGFGLMILARSLLAKPQSTVNYKTNVTFNDIYGMDEIKAQFKETINYFKSDKSKYRAIGARLKKGILLYGPSGTGKTLMARAVAGECDVNFIYQSASEFMDKYIGVGSSRVRELFKKARELQPCIIFIDEIDALGSRVLDKTLVDQSASIEKNNTINQLLTELDGFKDLKDIFVIAATNNIDAIDTSLLRAGRFDRKIGTRIPDLSERAGIFAKKLEKMKHEVTDEGIKAASTVGEFTGADIDAIVNEAAFISLRKELASINDESLIESAKYYANK